MRYLQYLHLRWRRFARSPFFQKKLLVKLILGFFLLMFYLEVVIFGIGTYYILNETAPGTDLFQALNRYDYMFFMLALSLLFMGMNTVDFDYKPLMILPVSKSRLALFHITDFFLTWPYWFLFSWLVATSTVFILNGYPASQVIAWAVIMFLLSLWLGVIYFISEKNPLWNFLASALMLAAILTAKTAPRYFGFIGEGIYRLSRSSYGVWIIWGLTVLIYAGVHAFIKRHIYLDDRAQGAEARKVASGQAWWEKLLGGQGISRAFIRNEISAYCCVTHAPSR